MSSEIIIRRSEPGDVPGLRACLDSVARERRFLSMLEAPSVEDVGAFSGSPDVGQVVAVDAWTIVGWGDVRRFRAPGFTHRGTLGMGLVASHRGRGIGSRLLTAVIALCPSLAITRLELTVFRSNAAAHRLYERHGFVLEGELPGARLLDGVADDVLLMRRWIG
jgi:RimJ/RimL family protein N-acetyltransferase